LQEATISHYPPHLLETTISRYQLRLQETTISRYPLRLLETTISRYQLRLLETTISHYQLRLPRNTLHHRLHPQQSNIPHRHLRCMQIIRLKRMEQALILGQTTSLCTDHFCLNYSVMTNQLTVCFRCIENVYNNWKLSQRQQNGTTIQTKAPQNHTNH